MSMYIHPRTQGERRANGDPTMSRHVRGKRRRLVTYWNDKPHARGGNSKPRHKDHR